MQEIKLRMTCGCRFFLAICCVLAGCQPIAPNERFPPLIDAVIADDSILVEKLLKSGSDPNEKMYNGYSAIGFAVKLHRNIPERQRRRLGGAQDSSREDLRVLQLLLDYGADPNVLNGSWGPSLNIAAFQGLTQSVQLLLSAGANPNLANPRGTTSLMIAAHHCYGDIARLLLEHGADPDRVDNAGETAHFSAERAKCVQVVGLISKHKNKEIPKK